MRLTVVLSILGAVESVRHKRRSDDVQMWSVESDVQMTAEGCVCQSTCEASKFDLFECDVCTTSRCGKFGIGRRYGNCLYPIKKSYESQTADEKDAAMWSAVTSDTTPGEFNPLLGVLTTSSITAFDMYMPEMPEGRVKSIHAIASTCHIDFNVKNSPYTGLLEDGVHRGLMRMGPASPFDETGAYTPGVGVKFPRSGVPSGDFVFMNSVDVLKGDFFGVNMSNHIPPPPDDIAKKLLVKKFTQASLCPGMVGLSDFAKYKRSGEEVATPRFPYKLMFVPTAAAHTSDLKNMDTLLTELAYPARTKLLDVYACASPSAAEDVAPTSVAASCGGAQHIGTLTTVDKCTTSAWADAKLHVRHQRVEEDWDLMPQWKADPQSKAGCGRSDKDYEERGPKPCVACMKNSDLTC